MDRAELADTVKAELRALIRDVLGMMSVADDIETHPQSACESITEWIADVTRRFDNLRKMLKRIEKG